MTDSSSAAIPRTRLNMPLLLLCGMGFGAFFAGLSLLVVGGILVMLPFTSTFTVNGASATRAEFIQQSWPLLVGFPIASGCALAVVYALWRELPWSRGAILGYWIVVLVAVCVMAIVTGEAVDLLPSILMFGSVIALLSWYLYRKPNVRAYYDALAELPHNRGTSPDIARRES
jgi:hypothetical protein